MVTARLDEMDRHRCLRRHHEFVWNPCFHVPRRCTPRQQCRDSSTLAACPNEASRQDKQATSATRHIAFAQAKRHQQRPEAQHATEKVVTTECKNGQGHEATFRFVAQMLNLNRPTKKLSRWQKSSSNILHDNSGTFCDQLSSPVVSNRDAP